MTTSSKSYETALKKHILVLRLIAGVPLLVLGAMHLLNPAGFREILEAARFPLIGVNVIAAPLAEVVAGFLLLSGLYARLGGLLGMGTMLPAIYATLALVGMDAANLPPGIAAVPEVPPLPVPILVLLSSAYVTWRGSGAWSLDSRTAPVASTVGDSA